MGEREDLEEAEEFAQAVAVELLGEPMTRAALFRALDEMPHDSPHREPLTELARCAVVLRSMQIRIRDLHK